MRLATFYQIIAVLIISKINGIYTSGKMYTTATNKQYFINPDQKYTWFDGLSECLKMNMTLVSIETQPKSEEINTLVKSIFKKNIILWVGGILTHYPDSRNYIWINTGEKFTYTFWKYLNPDFSLNNEYCIQIGSASDMEWNDNVCAVKYGFICEYDEKSLRAEQYKLEMERNLQKCQQDLKEQIILKDTHKMVSEELKNLRDLQKHQLELGEQLQKETRKLYEALQKQQEWQNFIAKQLQTLEPEENQENENKNRKYRDISFQFNQNTYQLSNGQFRENSNN
ncbi:lectin subunit alpha-like [Lucilia cuprina]|uniref:lectin subunit alpha-like n=1 Tax=Lucilia cuprina TaxID=7375 RepID=UPI001F0668DF|nr:lectin subunit alpha-like [Lucilia cuprina]